MARGTLLTRDDTFFGVCEGLGEDLRIPPNLLRLGFAGLLFVNPMLTIAGYFGLGGLVFLSRLLFPVPQSAPAPGMDAPAPRPAPAEAEGVAVAVDKEEERALIAA